jgi:Cu/Ag efflux pump CusA
MLPDGLKIVAYYDRSELVDAALWTVTKVLLEGVCWLSSCCSSSWATCVLR